jgi:hypothetical protein
MLKTAIKDRKRSVSNKACTSRRRHQAPTVQHTCIQWTRNQPHSDASLITTIIFSVVSNFSKILDSWTKHFVVSLWSNQQIRRSCSIIYWYIPNFAPACFSNSLPLSGVRITSEVTQATYVLRVYMDYNLFSVVSCRGMRPRVYV